MALIVEEAAISDSRKFKLSEYNLRSTTYLTGYSLGWALGKSG